MKIILLTCSLVLSHTALATADLSLVPSDKLTLRVNEKFQCGDIIKSSSMGTSFLLDNKETWGLPDIHDNCLGLRGQTTDLPYVVYKEGVFDYFGKFYSDAKLIFNPRKDKIISKQGQGFSSVVRGTSWGIAHSFYPERFDALVNVSSGKIILKLHEFASQELGDGSYTNTVSSASDDGRVIVYSVYFRDNGQTLVKVFRNLKLLSEQLFIGLKEIQVSPDGSKLIISDANKSEIYDINAKQKLCSMDEPVKLHQSRFTPDLFFLGNQVAGVYYEEIDDCVNGFCDLKIWDLNCKVTTTIESVPALKKIRARDNGKLMAIVQGYKREELYLIDLKTSSYRIGTTINDRVIGSFDFMEATQEVIAKTFKDYTKEDLVYFIPFTSIK